MGKNKFVGHPPRPTKTELHKAAQEQHKADETKVLTAAVAGDQQAVADTIVENLTAQRQEDSTGAPEAKPAAAAPAPAKDPVLYALGKKYAPKTDRNSGTWAILTKALSEGPKTMPQLAELVKGHKDFLGYMTRGGHIIPHVAKEVVEAAPAN